MRGDSDKTDTMNVRMAIELDSFRIAAVEINTQTESLAPGTEVRRWSSAPCKFHWTFGVQVPVNDLEVWDIGQAI
jgi:hypothetical protein